MPKEPNRVTTEALHQTLQRIEETVPEPEDAAVEILRRILLNRISELQEGQHSESDAARPDNDQSSPPK